MACPTQPKPPGPCDLAGSLPSSARQNSTKNPDQGRERKPLSDGKARGKSIAYSKAADSRHRSVLFVATTEKEEVKRHASSQRGSRLCRDRLPKAGRSDATLSRKGKSESRDAPRGGLFAISPLLELVDVDRPRTGRSRKKNIGHMGARLSVDSLGCRPGKFSGSRERFLLSSQTSIHLLQFARSAGGLQDLSRLGRLDKKWTLARDNIPGIIPCATRRIHPLPNFRILFSPTFLAADCDSIPGGTNPCESHLPSASCSLLSHVTLHFKP